MNILWNEYSYLLLGFLVTAGCLCIGNITYYVKKVRVTKLQQILFLLFGIYLTVLFAYTISPTYGWSVGNFGKNINFIPLKVLDTVQINPLNFYGNVVMMIPFGMCLVLLLAPCHSFMVTTLCGFFCSVLIECIQLFEFRATDIDDVILNTMGTIIGWVIGIMIKKTIPYLSKSTGVIKRRGHDFGIVVLLYGMVLCSVMMVGFSIQNSYKSTSLGKDDNFENIVITESIETKTMVPLSGELNLEAENVYVSDLDGTVCYNKKSEERIAPASLTKLLTALVVMDYCDLDDVITVGDELTLVAVDASTANLSKGEQLTVRQMLVAMLLPSGNDAAYSLAAHTGKIMDGSNNISISKLVDCFIEQMNEKALELGAKNSCFLTPDGYDTHGQYTTAEDMYIIAKATTKVLALTEIMGTYEENDRWVSGQKVTYYNSNAMLDPDSSYYNKYVTGLKTGTTTKAGACLISSFIVNGQEYISVVMGSSADGRYVDTQQIFDYLVQK